MQKPKRPRDPNQLAKLVVDLATGEESEPVAQDDGKDPAAVALGRRGGQARAKKLNKKRRAEIARRAAAKRWRER